MNVFPEIREQMVAAAARAIDTQHPTGPAWSWSRVRPHRLVPVLASAGALAVGVVALVSLHHRAAAPGASGSPSGISALEAKLAVLRRPATAADRFPNRKPGRFAVKTSRLATTVNTPTARLRIYVIVQSLPSHWVARKGQAALSLGVRAVDVNANDWLGASTGLLTAATLNPSDVASGPPPGLAVAPAVYNKGFRYDYGAAFGLVPDGVARVKWVFTGAGIGITHPHPTTIYPTVRNNVAAAVFDPSDGPLASATWYDTSGSVIARSNGGLASRQRLIEIRAINNAPSRPIAPVLLAHYALFHSIPADDPAHDPQLPTPGVTGGYEGEMHLNYWQTRYVRSLTGLDGRGLWITPGTTGICISDPQTTSCGTLNHRDTSAIIGTATTRAGSETLSGLAPDGNKTITLVLSTGAHRTIPVIDHNVWETTLPGRIIALIDRNTSGRTTRVNLR